MQRQKATKLIRMGQPTRDHPMVQLRVGRRAVATVPQCNLSTGTGVAALAHREDDGVVIRTAAEAPAAEVQEAAAARAVATALAAAAALAVGLRGLRERLLLRWQ